MEIKFDFATQEKIEPVKKSAAELLRELQHRQNELVELQRANLHAIAEMKIKLRQEQAESERLARLAELEAEKQKIMDSMEETKNAIEALELVCWDKAHPYQKEGVIATLHAQRKGESGFFNADDMGLGKTFQAITTILALFKQNPDAKCLWLTKTSILKTGGTKREIDKWSQGLLKVVEVFGNEPSAMREFKCELLGEQKGIIVLTNYETLRTTKSLQDSKYEYIVMDEVHKLKGGANPSGPTALWKAVKEFTPKADFILMLSGTPMVNRVAELWAYLHIFDPIKFDNLRQFERAFNIYQEMGGKVQTGKILDLCLKDRMVRRERHEVGLQLPEMTVEIRDLMYNEQQQEVADQMKKQFYIWLDEQNDVPLTATAIIAQLLRLRQISVWPVFSQTRTDPETGEPITVSVNVEDSCKIDEAMDIIEEANDQVVVFCNFNEPFNEIQRRCRLMNLRCEIIRGDTSKVMGDYEVEFQQGKIDVLCINSSMGEGLNLQKNPDQWSGGASIGIHLDRWWNPARDMQCNARIHRQGANNPVTIYMLHTPNSVDDFVAALSDEKAALFDGIMSDKKLRPTFEWKEDLRKLMGD